MPFLTIAYSESIDEAGVYANIAAVSDKSIKVYGDRVYVPEYRFLTGLAIMAGTTGVAGLLRSPSLRRTNYYYQSPVAVGLVPSTANCDQYFPEHQVELEMNEPLEALINAAPAGAEQHTVVVHLADGPITPVNGETYEVAGTITLALVAGQWVNSEITFVDELPTGDYTVIGARVNAPSATAFRLVPIGSAYYPGGLCSQTAGDIDHRLQRRGGMGEWFRFNTVQPPSIDVISSAAVASATYNVFLDILVS